MGLNSRIHRERLENFLHQLSCWELLEASLTHLFVLLNRNFNLEMSAIRSLRASIPETAVVLSMNEQGKSLWARRTYRHLRGPLSQVWPDDRRRAI